MTKLYTRLSILQVFFLIILTVFYFSYMLIPNPDPYLSIRGVYYTGYIWPVGVMLHSILGIAGWQIFSAGMSLWFFYSLPIFVVVQGLIGIQIPFNPNPLTVELVQLSALEWFVMGAVVVAYNIFIIMVLPYFIRAGFFMLKSLRYAEIKGPDSNDAHSYHRSGIEDEFREDS